VPAVTHGVHDVPTQNPYRPPRSTSVSGTSTAAWRAENPRRAASDTRSLWATRAKRWTAWKTLTMSSACPSEPRPRATTQAAAMVTDSASVGGDDVVPDGGGRRRSSMPHVGAAGVVARPS